MIWIAYGIVVVGVLAILAVIYWVEIIGRID